MSQDKEILSGITDALGLSGQLFILWDKNERFVSCDNVIREKLKSIDKNFEKDFNLYSFTQLLEGNDYFTSQVSTSFLNTYRNSIEKNELISF